MENLGEKELAQLKVYMMTNGYSERTIRSYIPYIREFIGYIKEKSIEKLSEVTPEVISQYQIYVAALKFRDKRLSIKTQNMRMLAIIKFFRFLVGHKNYLYDPTSHIKVKDPPRQRTRETLTEREMERLLNAPDPEMPLGLRDKAMLEVFYSCGIRNTELRTLVTTDVDFEKRLIRIRKPKGGGGDQVVPVGKVAAIYLQEYLRYGRPKLLKNDLEETLFLTKSGRPLGDDMPSHIVRKYAKIAKIKRKTDAHSIRHTCGTHLHSNGADIRYVQELLRHKSLETTQVYVHVKAEDLKKVLAKTHPREKGIVYAPAID